MARHKVTYRYDDETDDGGWLVECPELGVFTEGSSLREARRMAREAMELALESADFELTEDVVMPLREAVVTEIERIAHG